jgi:hypothetical protein
MLAPRGQGQASPTGGRLTVAEQPSSLSASCSNAVPHGLNPFTPRCEATGSCEWLCFEPPVAEALLR